MDFDLSIISPLGYSIVKIKLLYSGLSSLNMTQNLDVKMSKGSQQITGNYARGFQVRQTCVNVFEIACMLMTYPHII